MDIVELLKTRGVEHRIDGAVTAVASSRDGQTFAIGTIDGEIWLISVMLGRDVETWRRIQAHDGAVLALTADCGASGFLSGGEDNRLVRTDADGSTLELYRGRRWVDTVRSTPTHLAFSTGKQVELRGPDGIETLKILDHPSTVTGIAFDAKGKRLAAAHYGGVSLWFVQAKVDSVRMLEWKGSHTGLAIQPNGEALVSSMQEPELHGWRLADGHNMRMSGYPRRVESMDFIRSGRWLATSGADSIVMWPFFGGGPMGKAPMELAHIDGVICSQVRAHPQHDMVAAGYENGTVLLADTGSERILPVCMEGRGKIGALDFTPQGGFLAFGSEDGVIGFVDLSTGA